MGDKRPFVLNRSKPERAQVEAIMKNFADKCLRCAKVSPTWPTVRLLEFIFGGRSALNFGACFVEECCGTGAISKRWWVEDLTLSGI